MLDAELTVPGSLIFHFLNQSPISPTSRPVPISSETSPLGLLSLPDPSSRRSCKTPAKTPRIPTPGNGSPSSRKSSDHAGDKAREGTARERIGSCRPFTEHPWLGPNSSPGRVRKGRTKGELVTCLKTGLEFFTGWSRGAAQMATGQT